MIIVFAGQEGSQVSDSHYGKPIFVSTTARILFRAANPDYKKQRNAVLNKLIAEMFSKATIEDKNFRPKGGSNTMGEFRSLGSMRFVAVIDPNSIRVLSVKGSIAQLPAITPTQIQAPNKTSSLRKAAGFEAFVNDHMSEYAKKRLKLSDNAFARLEAYLLPLYDKNRSKMLKSICKRENEADIKRLLSDHLLKEDVKHLHMQNSGPSDALSIKHQL